MPWGSTGRQWTEQSRQAHHQVPVHTDCGEPSSCDSEMNFQHTRKEVNGVRKKKLIFL